MKRDKPMPVPQKEFGFTVETFNLFQESTLDGERITREQEQAKAASEREAAEQAQMFQTEP